MLAIILHGTLTWTTCSRMQTNAYMRCAFSRNLASLSITLLRYSAHLTGLYSSMRSPCGLHCRSTLTKVIESVQRKVLRIMLPDLSYSKALHRASLQSFSERRAEAWCKFLLRSQHREPMKSILYIDTIQHDYNLHSGRSRIVDF